MADLTDPMLSPEDANCVFQVLLEQFRCMSQRNKLAVFDEAHKYLNESSSSGLAIEMVNISRQMRHQDMRMIVSTQNPSVLPAEMLELATVIVAHEFHSQHWFDCLQKRVRADPNLFSNIAALQQGEAMVFARKTQLQQQFIQSTCLWHRVQIRRRLTCDGGASHVHGASKPAS